MNEYQTPALNRTNSTGLDASNLEQMKKLKPLEHLLRAKNTLLVEMELELCHPRLSAQNRRLIEEKRTEILIQIEKINQIIQGVKQPRIENPTASEAGTALEEPGFPFKTAIAFTAGFMLGVGLMVGTGTEIGTSSIATVPTIATAPTIATTPKIVTNPGNKRNSLVLDGVNAFEVNRLATNPVFFDQLKKQIQQNITPETKEIEVQIHTKIMPGSPRSEANQKNVKTLTQKRADSLVQMLQTLPELKGISLIPVGMGDEAGIGKKIVLKFSNGS